MSFRLLSQDVSTRARRGVLTTAHGVVQTPVFMPVGTQGTVKAMTPRELTELGTQILLGNTYHLFIRPGLEIRRADCIGSWLGTDRSSPTAAATRSSV